jgi:hypothetical protein
LVLVPGIYIHITAYYSSLAVKTQPSTALATRLSMLMTGRDAVLGGGEGGGGEGRGGGGRNLLKVKVKPEGRACTHKGSEEGRADSRAVLSSLTTYNDIYTDWVASKKMP